VTTQSSEPALAPRLGELFLASFQKLASVQPGERVLDLTAREGEALVVAAIRAGETGEVRALESDPARLQAALERARRDGLTGITGEVADPAHIPGPDSYWDVTLSHLALPHVSDPEAMLRESMRVLRPVGRIAVSSWGQRDRCPLLTIFLDAIRPFNPQAVAAADRALFRYAESGVLAVTLAEAGFQDATPERLTEWPAFADVAEYWDVLASDSRLADLVAPLTAEQIAEARQTIEAKTKFYRRRTGLELKVEGIVLVAVK
jgi:ubiquinone/menaquinone biosynthesis C-methylase UbiE